MFKRGLLGFLVGMALWGAAWLPAQAQPMTGFADMVERIGPAVVNISTETRAAKAADTAGPRRSGPPATLEEFFRDFMQNFPSQILPENALGSGVIISPDGYIVTNHHVVARAERIKVILLDDTEFTAKIIGSDEKNDLALLKVDNKNR